MGINPSFKGKKKKNRFLGVPAPGKSQAVSQHQPQKRLRKKQKDLSWEPGYWGRSSQRGSTFCWLDSQSTDTRRHRGAVFNVFPKPQPRRPSQPSGGGAALRWGAERGRRGLSCPGELKPQPRPPSALASPTRAHPAHRGLPRRLRPWGPPPWRRDARRWHENWTRRHLKPRIMADPRV